MSPGTGPRRAPRLAVDDDGFWIQYSVEDGVGRVGPEGWTCATYSRGAELVCAGVDGAWLKQSSHRLPHDLSSSPDVPPRYEPTSTVLHVDRTGEIAEVPVEGLVFSMREEFGELYLFVHQPPWSRVLIDCGGDRPRDFIRYRVEWATSTMSLPLNQTRPTTLLRTEHATTSLPADTSYLQDYADESYNEAHLRKRADGDGVRWHWGRDDSHDERTTVRAFETDTGRLIWERRVDAGWLMRGTAEKHRAWLLIRGTTRSGGGTRLEVWDPRAQTAELISTTDDLDISAHRWPTGPCPADHDSYASFNVSQWNGYEFSEHVTDVRAKFVGEWPDGCIELSYRHDAYPGIILRSKVDIYDEVGRNRPDYFHYLSSELFEQAGTNAYPSVHLAVNGILDV